MIVAATLNMRVPSVIKIWVYEPTPPAIGRNNMRIFDRFVNAVLLVAAFVVLYKYLYPSPQRMSPATPYDSAAIKVLLEKSKRELGAEYDYRKLEVVKADVV
jgi:hypothetical protein